MKTKTLIILALLILILIPTLSFAGALQEKHRSVIAKKNDYADILFYWGCESTTPDYSAGDTSAGAQSQAAINTDAAKIGTNGCDFPSDYDRYQFTVSSDDLIVGDHGRAGFWYRSVTFANNAYLFSYTVDGNNVMYIYQLTPTNNHLSFYYKAGGTSTSVNVTTAIADETWTFVEFAWNNTGNEYKFFLNGEQQGATVTTDLPDWVGTGGANVLQIGESAGTNTDFHIDQVFISNDPTRDLYAIANCTTCNP